MKRYKTIEKIMVNQRDVNQKINSQKDKSDMYKTAFPKKISQKRLR